MKKNCICIILLITLFFSVPAFANVGNEDVLDEANVLNLVLKDSNVKEENVLYNNINLKYEIEFYDGIKMYQYIVDARSGEILNSRIEEQKSEKDKANFSSSKKYIEEEEALLIVMTDCGLQREEIKYLSSRFENDDWPEYEIEFYDDFTKYEYTIDAITGKIVEREITNWIVGNDINNEKEKYIGVTRAKEIALAHSKFQEEDVNYLSCYFERDDGVDGYEVNWKRGRFEYEYWIDAFTGKIIDYEIDSDD